MNLSRFLTSLSAKRRPATSFARLSIAAALAATGSLPQMSATAQATDLDYTQSIGGQQDDGNFLRIAIGKSAVIKLPAAAKDVIVGDPTVVDVVLRNRNTAYFFARQPAQTNVFFFDANGNQILNLDLEVSVDSKAVKKLIDRTIPGNAIVVDSTGKNIVLKGTVANGQDSKLAEDLVEQSLNGQCDCKVVNAMKIAEGDQVMLKVRVVELKRSLLKDFGIRTSTNISVGNFGFNFKTGGRGYSGNGNYSNAGGGGADSFSTNISLDALESEGLASTLAEPTLTAVSGSPARFHAGGEFPYRICTRDHYRTDCEVQFKAYGVSLDFTPTVLTEGRINLAIRTEVSELGQVLDGVPSIDTRNAQTAVEIPSGGSMMLAGLIKDVSAQDLAGTPGLRKLPILGALFNSRSYQRNQTEMVVIVTPYIVNPTSEAELATPTDGLNAPTDRQGILFGRLNKVYGTPGKHPNGVYHGKVGYIIE